MFTCVLLVFTCVHLCSLVFTCVHLFSLVFHLCSTCVHLCSICVHLCSFVFICVPLAFICVPLVWCFRPDRRNAISLECYNLFSGVELSMRSFFVIIIIIYLGIASLFKCDN